VSRAVLAVLAAALVTGIVTAAVAAPGAVAGPEPAPLSTISAMAPASHIARPTHEDGRLGRQASPPATMAVPTSFAPPAPAGTGAVTDPTTEAQVATDLIDAVDARSGGRYAIVATPDNVILLETWMDNEGGLWADNPLNTSLDAARYPDQRTTSGEDTGIPIFPDIQIGIDATAATLLSGHVYAGILQILGEGTASCDAFARAVMASPWAASHYGGNPSHFCGASGGFVPSGIVTTTCLRVRGGTRKGSPRSERMPGACGRAARAPGRGDGGHRQLQGHEAHKAPAVRHHGVRSSAALSRLAHPALRPGSVRRRR